MADYIVPVTWKLFSRTENAVTYIRPGHTVKEPRLAIFDRVVPVSSGKGSRSAQTRVRIIAGEVDSLGNPISSRVIAEAIVKHLPTSNVALAISCAADLALVIGNADFQQDVVVEQLLP